MGALGIDSDQYLSVAGEMIGVRMPNIGGVSTFESGWHFRIPGYPLLLALFLIPLHFGAAITNCIVLLHFTLFLGATIGLIFALRKRFNLTQVILCLIFGSLVMRHYYFTVLSEWAAFSFLLCLLAALVSALRDRSKSAYFAAALSASAATLVRPDYIILVPLVLLCACFRRETRITLYLSITLGLIPLLILLAINFDRFGRITLVPAESGAIVLSSMLIDDEFTSKLEGHCAIDSETIRSIKRIPAHNFIRLSYFDAAQFLDAGTDNYLILTQALRRKTILDWPAVNTCLMKLHREVIATYPFRYLVAVALASLSAAWVLPLVFIFFVASRRQVLSFETKTLVILALAIHFTHVGLVCAVNVIHGRYYHPTLGLLTCALGFVVIDIIRSRFSRDAN